MNNSKQEIDKVAKYHKRAVNLILNSLSAKANDPICPKCGGKLTLEEVITHRTTSPREDDTIELGWQCRECDYFKRVEK